MKKNVIFRAISLFLLFSLSITFNLSAEILILKSGRKVEGNVVKETSKAFLWQVQSSTSKVYLLGSIHLAKPDMYPLDEKIENAYKNSDILVVEVNTNKYNDHVLQQKFLGKGIYSSGQSLKSNLSARTYDLLEEKLNELRINIEQVNHLKPWFLALNLTVMNLRKLGFNPEYGIDQYFLNKAKGTKEIAELESVNYQINFFDGFSTKMQDKFLLSTLIDLNIMEEQIANVITAWKRGDADKLNEILFAEFERYPQLQPVFYKLFDERNEKMVSKIESYLKDSSSYFVVVGAGHLVGEEGIINLLRKKGYSANQL